MNAQERIERELDCMYYLLDCYMSALMDNDLDKGQAYLENMLRSIKEVKRLQVHQEFENTVNQFVKLHNKSSELLKEAYRW